MNTSHIRCASGKTDKGVQDLIRNTIAKLPVHWQGTVPMSTFMVVSPHRLKQRDQRFLALKTKDRPWLIRRTGKNDNAHVIHVSVLERNGSDEDRAFQRDILVELLNLAFEQKYVRKLVENEAKELGFQTESELHNFFTKKIPLFLFRPHHARSKYPTMARSFERLDMEFANLARPVFSRD